VIGTSHKRNVAHGRAALSLDRLRRPADLRNAFDEQSHTIFIGKEQVPHRYSNQIVNLEKARGQLAAHELMCLAEVNPDLNDILAELGISAETTEAFDLCQAHGFFSSEGLFEFDSYGEAVLAFVVDEPMGGYPLDVLAISFVDPGRFGTRKGQAALLGHSFLREHTKSQSDPCPVYPNPGVWLQNGGQGVCILTAIPAATFLTASGCHFAAWDRDCAQALVDSGAIPLHRLWVRDDRRAA
jgi:hypothetical protein